MAPVDLSRRAITEIIKTMKGMFAVCKPKNTTVNDVVEMIRLQISDDVGFSLRHHGVLFNHGGMLEYPAEGVIVCGLGMVAQKKMVYFRKGEKKYNVTVKLGQATDTHDANGIITEEKPYEVIYTQRFIIRTFVHELGKALGSCAHISSMERTAQGIITAKDALPTYRWSWPSIQESIENLRVQINDYIRKMMSLEHSNENKTLAAD